MIKELANFFGGFFCALILSRHPHLCSLFNNLFADCMHPCIEGTDCARALRSHMSDIAELCEQLVESFHESSLSCEVGRVIWLAVVRMESGGKAEVVNPSLRDAVKYRATSDESVGAVFCGHSDGLFGYASVHLQPDV